jgi:hypothetical protein
VNEAIRLGRIFSKKELFCVLEDIDLVATCLKVLRPENQNLSVTLDVSGKIPKTRFRC